MPAMRCVPFLLALALCGCAASMANPPSLGPRIAESIDPRLPVPEPEPSAVVTPALASRLTGLIADAEAGDAQFRAAAAAARQAAAAAGPPQSESWVVAQQALSVLVASRAPVTRALGDIDAAAAARIQGVGGVAPADLNAIQAAAARVGAIDRRQAALIDELQARLG